MNKPTKTVKVEKVKKELSQEEDKQKRVDEFKKEISDVFLANLTDKTRRLLISNLLDQYAWLSVSLKDLSELINGREFIEKYQNGDNQWGVKKSAYIETYNDLAKTLTKINKELVATLPKGSISGDMLDEFNNKYKD